MQRPCRERHAAGSRRREQPRGHHAGHRDLVADPPPDRRAPAREDGSEEQHVPREGETLEEERRREPRPVALRGASPRLVQSRQARQDEVQDGDRSCDEEDTEDDAAPRQGRVGHLPIPAAAAGSRGRAVARGARRPLRREPSSPLRPDIPCEPMTIARASCSSAQRRRTRQIPVLRLRQQGGRGLPASRASSAPASASRAAASRACSSSVSACSASGPGPSMSGFHSSTCDGGSHT